MKDLAKPAGIVVHHSLTKDGTVVDWDAIKHYHMTAPEYMMDDIGYHAGVERVDGIIYTFTGRPINKEGGHTKGHNDMLGICAIGNFDLYAPNDGMLEALADMVRSWLTMFPHLTKDDVHPHYEYADYKSCPGRLFPWAYFKEML